MKLASARVFVIALLLGACGPTVPLPGPTPGPLPPGAINAAPGAFAMLPAEAQEATIVVTEPTTLVILQSGKVRFQGTFTTELPRTLPLPLPRLGDGSAAPLYLLAMQVGVELAVDTKDDGQCIRCWDGGSQARGQQPPTSGPIDRPCCPPPPAKLCL